MHVEFNKLMKQLLYSYELSEFLRRHGRCSQKFAWVRGSRFRTVGLCYCCLADCQHCHDMRRLATGTMLRYNWYSNPCGYYCLGCAVYVGVAPLGQLSGAEPFLPQPPFIVDIPQRD